MGVSVSKKKKRFRRFLLIYSAVLIALGAVILCVLWRFLKAYEASRPQNVIDAFVASCDDDTWLGHMLPAAAAVDSGFEDGEQIVRSYFDGFCRGNRAAAFEVGASTLGEEPTYRVRAGNAYMCTVTLKKGDPVGFSLNEWEIGSVTSDFSLYGLTAHDVEISAVSPDEVFLNGISVDASYTVRQDALSGENAVVDNAADHAPQVITYRIDGLYGAVRVEDAAGTVYAPGADSDGDTFRFDLTREGTCFAVIVAPVNATVSCNGIELREGESLPVDVSVFEGFESYMAADTGNVRYTLNGLYTVPSVEAVLKDGTKLVPADENGTTVFAYPNDDALQRQQEETVRAFFDAYMGYSAGSGKDYKALRRCLLKGTRFYEYITDSVMGMYWASQTAIDYEYLTFGQFRSHGEDTFTCRVSYKATLTAKSWEETNVSTQESAYDILFIRVQDKKGEKWYVANMAVVK